MNKFFTVLFVSLMLTGFNAVSQQADAGKSGFNYQAALRNDDGSLLRSASINLKISIRQNDPEGQVVYQEGHTTATDDLGMISLEIGNGIVSQGEFNTINWENGTYWLEVALDKGLNNNYKVLGATKIGAVPFALHAQQASSITPSLYNELKGTQWHEGITAPDHHTEGIPGDYYMNINTAKVYRMLDNHTWAYRGILTGNVNGENRSDPNDWTTSGNAGTNPSTNFIGTTDNNGLAFRINNTEEMRLTGKGLVIGQASVPNNHLFTLRQQSDDKFSGMKIINAANTRSARFFVGSNGTVFDAQNGTFMLRNFNQDRFFVDLNGYVGIGTKTPAKLLDVDGDALVSGSLEVNTTTGALTVPRLTTSQRNILAAEAGNIIFNVDDNKFQGFKDSTHLKDQFQYYINSMFWIDNLGSQGQSFTAGMTGELKSIAIFISDSAQLNPGDFTLKIYAGAGTDSNVLSSQTVNITASGYKLINISSTVNITSGAPYTFEFSTATSTLFNWAMSNSNPYGGGKRWANGTPQSGDDFYFETYIWSSGQWVDLH